MKISRLIVAVFVLVLCVTNVKAEDPVCFADANLKAAVEEALGIVDPTPTDMLSLYHLSAGGRGIVDLAGLEYADNLTRLNLQVNSISDIAALSVLTNLEYLSLNFNNISDISAVSSLTNLTNLQLSFNNISNISALCGLTNLKVLALYDADISDITPLAGLTKLTSLTIGGADADISDISVLSCMPNLYYLSLPENNINDISVLSSLTNLTNLYLSDNNISDISALSSLINMRMLFLNNNNIDDITALSALTDLYWLHLDGNNINDISALSGMTAMTFLWLHDNNISDISALSDMMVMRGLYLYGNDISDISALSEMTRLWRLYLQSNPLDCAAYHVYIPLTRENNPGIGIRYDPMPAHCENEPPVAEAGDDQRVAVADIVSLDGSASSDPDDDSLTYQWSFASMPVGSTATIAEPTEVETVFIPDLPGDYVVSLVVNDGTVDSEPDTVTITAIPPEQAAQETLEETKENIGLIPPANLHNDNAVKPLTNKINAVLGMIDEGLFEDALVKLQDDILKKTDGCAEIGEPDATDWLLNCDDQDVVYPLVMRAIELLLRLVE